MGYKNLFCISLTYDSISGGYIYVAFSFPIRWQDSFFFFFVLDSASVVVHVVSGERPAAMQSNSKRICPLPPLLLLPIRTSQLKSFFIIIMLYILLMSQYISTNALNYIRFLWNNNSIRRFVTRWPALANVGNVAWNAQHKHLSRIFN